MAERLGIMVFGTGPDGEETIVRVIPVDKDGKATVDTCCLDGATAIVEFDQTGATIGPVPDASERSLPLASITSGNSSERQ